MDINLVKTSDIADSQKNHMKTNQKTNIKNHIRVSAPANKACTRPSGTMKAKPSGGIKVGDTGIMKTRPKATRGVKVIKSLRSLPALASLLLASLLFTQAYADLGLSGYANISANNFTSLDISPEYIRYIKRSNSTTYQNIERSFDYFTRKYDAGYEFIPTLRSLIIEANVPQEFLFLAMVESEFSLRAYSNKRAVGLWQIMPVTARELGLKINRYIDERRDPIKSTKAAIKYLRYLYKETGKWYLAAIAYNCGLGRLNRAIAEAGSSELEVLVDPDIKYLPKETRHYIAKIVSMSIVFNGVDKLDRLEEANRAYLLNRSAMQDIMPVSIKAGTPLKVVAKGAGIPLATLRHFNRQFRYSFTPPGRGEYTVYLPYKQLSYFKQNYQEIKGSHIFIVHRIKKGETLSSIAKKYNVSIRGIKSINNLKSSRLSIKQRLIIPVIKNSYARK